MSSRRNKRKGVTLSEHVQNVQQNAFLPPGSHDATHSDQEAQATTEGTAGNDQQAGEAYPAVTIVDEAEHKAQEEKAAQDRVERAKRVSVPKNLSQQEMLNLAVILKLVPENALGPVALEKLPDDLRESFFRPGRNMTDRNLVKLLKNPETGQFDALEITDIGFEVYQRKIGKLTKQPRELRQRTARQPRVVQTGDYIEFTDDLRIKKLHDNPRKKGTKGWYSWQLYQDGMNYKEYLAKRGYPEGSTGWPEEWITTKGKPFKGPSHADFTWDLDHRFIGLYREGQEEKLPDGSDNPNYWVNHQKN